jgi:NADH dehydrogenase
MLSRRANLDSRICVLGGTGFMGQRLCHRLAQAGYDIVVPTRNPARDRPLLASPGVQLRTYNQVDTKSLVRLMQQCGTVINLVGILNERGHSGKGFERAHVALAESLIEACAELGIRRVVQVSALKASAERGPSHYLRTKGQAEQIIAAGRQHGIHHTIFQPSVVYGPQDSFLNRFGKLLQLSPLLPLPKPTARFAPVHVDDVVNAITRALSDEKAIDQTYELCGPDTLTLQQIVTFIRDTLGLKRLIIPLPDSVGFAQAFVCDYLVPGKPFSLDNFRSLTVASVCTNNGFARLGMKPREFRAAAHQILDAREPQLTRIRRISGR